MKRGSQKRGQNSPALPVKRMQKLSYKHSCLLTMTRNRPTPLHKLQCMTDNEKLMIVKTLEVKKTYLKSLMIKLTIRQPTILTRMKKLTQNPIIVQTADLITDSKNSTEQIT